MKPYKIKINKLNLTAPPPRTYTEFEMEKSLNKWRAIKRKREIMLLKDDLLLDKPLCTQSYINPIQRKSIFKNLGRILIKTLRNLLP